MRCFLMMVTRRLVSDEWASRWLCVKFGGRIISKVRVTVENKLPC